MVDDLRELEMVTTEPVAAALLAVPRHLFAAGEPPETVHDVNATLAPKLAPDGTKLSVISAPHIQAAMLEQAQIKPGMNVLEVGSGGYNAALLAELVGPNGAVTTVDIDPEICELARSRLDIAGYRHVRVLQADAEHGVPERAPYDRIIVTVGAADLPPAWIHQLHPEGRMVVPLQFAGITRLVAFDHNGAGGLISRSYRLGSFVPMQGDGAQDEHLVPINGAVTLRVDQAATAETLDVAALRKAVHTPRIARWSGTAFDFPDELDLFLLTCEPEIPMYVLYAGESLVEQEVFTPAALRGAPTLVDGGSFGYRSKRTNNQIGAAPGSGGGRRYEEQTAGFESGVVAYGPNAETVADQYLQLLRRWARDYRRRCAARIEYHPNSSDVGHVNGWRTNKKHGTVTVNWP
ncbi:methyltransferase, FxLD system [Natronosporangium hydrolyticum]|uniref:Protein-L-isoaspartate O-methyltransferase n=2 Tax=Natronosporangium hydrolyticum TaxID=2811111 RepID=A0A895YBL9_9ACTN|nr:methyltransferase, FxLD system [Natronosporangium hydrolyticum]